jgi:hypothetical protein
VIRVSLKSVTLVFDRSKTAGASDFCSQPLFFCIIRLNFVNGTSADKVMVRFLICDKFEQTILLGQLDTRERMMNPQQVDCLTDSGAER